MLDNKKIAEFITNKRKAIGLTQTEIADRLNVSFQAVSEGKNVRRICHTVKRVLNGLGQFASLYDIDFPEIKNPVLVLKSEEPGSKQKPAMEYGYSESICHDMINHLVNDIVVMGAKPLAVLDTIVCGNAEKETIKSFVKGISQACTENKCTLVGGRNFYSASSGRKRSLHINFRNCRKLVQNHPGRMEGRNRLICNKTTACIFLYSKK